MILEERRGAGLIPLNRHVASSALHLQGCSEVSGFRKWTGSCGSSTV